MSAVRDVASRALRASPHTTAVDAPRPGLTSQRELLVTSIPTNRIGSTGASSRYTTVAPGSTVIGSDRTLAWPIRSARNKYVSAWIVGKLNRPKASVRRQFTCSPLRFRSTTEAPSMGTPVSASTRVPTMAWAPRGVATSRPTVRNPEKAVTRHTVRAKCGTPLGVRAGTLESLL